MAYRELELTLLSARDLKNVNMFTRMDVYAVASISGDPMTRQSTQSDTTGGRNPCWNATFRFNIPPSAAAAGGGGWLHVLLRSERALGDRDVGEVVIPLAELLDGADEPGPQPARLASYQVHTVLRGEPRGLLNVSYRLGPVVAPVERADAVKPPVYAYPAPEQPFKPQNLALPPQPYQYNDYDYNLPNNAYQQPSPQQPFKPQNPTPAYQYQYSPPHNAYQQPPAQQPFKPQNPAPAYQYSPPHNTYQPPPPQQPLKPLNSAPQSPYQYSPPHNSYHRPSRHEEEALSPAGSGGKSNGHDVPNQVYMGPHTQIIFNSGGYPTTAPQSNTTTPQAKEHGSTKPKPHYAPTLSNSMSMPTKEEDAPTKPKQYYTSTTHKTTEFSTKEDAPTKPKPYYAPPQSKQQSLGKTDYSDSNWPNASPRKPDHSTTRNQHETKVSEQAHHTPSKTGPVKTDQATRPQQQQDNKQGSDISSSSRKGTQVEPTQPNTQHPNKAADSTRPKEAYATNRSNSTPPAKEDHQSGPKSALQQYERVRSLQTAAAR